MPSGIDLLLSMGILSSFYPSDRLGGADDFSEAQKEVVLEFRRVFHWFEPKTGCFDFLAENILAGAYMFEHEFGALPFHSIKIDDH